MKKLIILSAAIFCTFMQTKAQNILNQFWETNGPVNSSIRINNKLYVGGQFSYAGPTTGSFVAFSLASGNKISLPVSLHGKVNDIVRDNSGNVYIAGRFSVNGNADQSLLKLNASMSPDNSFQFDFDGEIRKLALNGNNLYAAGTFSNVNSQLRLSLAAIDINSKTLSNFAPNPDGQVMALTVANGNLYVGGLFSIISSASRTSLAAYSSSNALLSFDVSVNGGIRALAVKDSLLFAGGTFDSLGGLYRKGVGSINLNTSEVRSWHADVNGTVNDIAVNLLSVYIGGNFSQVGTQVRNNLASVNIFLSVVDAFDPGVDAEVTDIRVNGGLIFIGGDFNSIGFDTKAYFAGIGLSSAVSNALIPRLNGPAGSTLFIGDTVIVGGAFSSFGGLNVNNLAAFDANTGNPASWPVQIDGPVNVLKQVGTEILVGGDFTSVNSVFRKGVAMIDTVDGTPTSFDVESDGVISDALLLGSGLYLAGSFGYLGSTVRNNLALVNASTGAVQSWNPNVNGPVNKLMLNQTQLYAMGDFNLIGSLSRPHIASFELSSNGELRNWVVTSDSSITSAVGIGSGIFVGGYFSTINGQSRTAIAALDSANASVKSWVAPLQGGVSQLLSDNVLLFAGGNIVSSNNNTGLLCFNSTNGQEVDFPVKLQSGTVSSLSQMDSRLVVGGNYTLENALGKSNFSMINLSVSAPSAQATAVSFSHVTPTTMQVHFRKGNGSRYLVLASEGSAVDSFPLNGMAFSASQVYGSGTSIGSNYVVYNGTDSTFVLTGLNTGTTYHFSVFAYNGLASFTNYLTVNPAIGSIATIVGYNPPTVAASNITFADVRVAQMVVKWTSGNGSSRYVVVHEASAVTQIPSDSTQYFAAGDFASGTDLGSGNYIVYNGTGDSVLVTNLKAGFTYYYKVFEYNGVGQFARVLATAAASSRQTLSFPPEPTTGATSMSFSNTTKQSTQINWTSGNGGNRIVIASEGSAVVTLPVDGETYFTDNTFNGVSSFLSNNERVVYVGSGNQFTLSGLKPTTLYHFAVIEFNGSGFITNYQSANFLRGSITTASEVVLPVTPTKNIVFSNITKDSVSIKWKKGDGDKRLVVIKKSQIINSLPIQTASYNASLVFGSGDSLSDGARVVYFGTEDSIIVSGLTPNTQYYVSIFESNNSGSGPVYLTDSFAFSSFFTLPTGIKKISNDNNFKVYPNPLKGSKLIIELDKALAGNESVQITDLLGKTVYARDFGKNEAGEKAVELELGALATGQYLFQLISPTQIYTIKLLVN